MPATIVKGSVISAAATAGGMHALVESATISGIDRTCVDPTTISVATNQASPPTGPYSREVWQTSLRNGLTSYDLANTRWTGAIPQIVRYTLPATATAVTPGMALMPIGTGSLSDLTVLTLRAAITVGTDKVIAVALASCNPGEQSIAVVEGPVLVQCTGTVNAGESVRLSATTGVFESAGAAGTASGWQICGTAITADSGGFVWVNLRR
jgi:hypothetical protein